MTQLAGLRSRGFSKRLRKARMFEKQVFAEIEAMGFQIALNGTEHTHPRFVAQLRNSQDQTSLAIRFQPDGVACTEVDSHTFYVEAKNAKTIEKLAYEQYIKLSDSGNIVVVVFGQLNWGWTLANYLTLVDGNETVKSFPPDRRFRVIDGWLYPRLSSHWETIKWYNPQAAGTPYREIDSNSLLPWSQFRQFMLIILKS